MAEELVKGQRGMTTAEYAVGTVAVATGVGVLIKVISDPNFQAAIWTVIQALIKVVMSFLGN